MIKPDVITAHILLLILMFGCGSRSNQLEVGTFQSVRLKKEMGLSVLRAPRLADVVSAKLPVMIFLHGMGSDHLAFDTFGVSESIHSAMVKGEIPSVHLVFPNGERGFYVNWHDGTHPYEDYILYEVLPKAEALLAVDKTAPRHIAGVSMGGIGALQIGLRHPLVFSSVSCISSLILRREEAAQMMDQWLIRLLAPVKRVWGDGTDDAFSDGINPYQLVESLSSRPKLFLASGTKDSDDIINTTRRFHEHLDHLSVPHRYVVFEGEHTWRDWVPVIKQAIVAAVGDV